MLTLPVLLTEPPSTGLICSGQHRADAARASSTGGDPAGDPAESNETMDESDEPLEVDMGVQMGCFEEGPETGPPARKARHMDFPLVAISVLNWFAR